MSALPTNSDGCGQALVQKIRGGDREAFEQLFFTYYRDLCSVACRITHSRDRARDVVQDVFLRLWKNRERWELESSLKAYLYRAVWNEALNAKEKQSNNRELARTLAREQRGQHSPKAVQPAQESERLIRRIWEVVDGMPERRRFVFMLHRRDGLSYKEIAMVMEISRKTVENHMGLALRELREAIDPDLIP